MFSISRVKTSTGYHLCLHASSLLQRTSPCPELTIPSVSISSLSCTCPHQLFTPSLPFLSSTSDLALFSVYKNMVGSHATDHGEKNLSLNLISSPSPSCLIQPFEKNHLPLLSLFPLDFSTPNLYSPQNVAIYGIAFKAAFLCPIPA